MSKVPSLEGKVDGDTYVRGGGWELKWSDGELLYNQVEPNSTRRGQEIFDERGFAKSMGLAVGAGMTTLSLGCPEVIPYVVTTVGAAWGGLVGLDYRYPHDGFSLTNIRKYAIGAGVLTGGAFSYLGSKIAEVMEPETLNAAANGLWGSMVLLATSYLAVNTFRSFNLREELLSKAIFSAAVGVGAALAGLGSYFGGDGDYSRLRAPQHEGKPYTIEERLRDLEYLGLQREALLIDSSGGKSEGD